MAEPTTKNDTRQLLKRFLSQYFSAKQKQATLKQRLADLQAELRHPSITVPAYGKAPATRGKGQASSGAAAPTYRIAEIEAKIQRQMEIEARSVAEIMDMMELLPSDSTERDILEYRHIDCKSWAEIQRLVHLTRSPCFEYYNRGLDMLLARPEARKMLHDFCDRLHGTAKPRP